VTSERGNISAREGGLGGKETAGKGKKAGGSEWIKSPEGNSVEERHRRTGGAWFNKPEAGTR